MPNSSCETYVKSDLNLFWRLKTFLSIVTVNRTSKNVKSMNIIFKRKSTSLITELRQCFTPIDGTIS